MIKKEEIMKVKGKWSRQFNKKIAELRKSIVAKDTEIAELKKRKWWKKNKIIIIIIKGIF